MELIRGKTFIKSYAQNPPENVPSVGVRKIKNIESGRDSYECSIIKNNDSSKQGITRGPCVNEQMDNICCPKSVRKSKTHDCVTKENSSGQISAKSQIPSSISFSGFENISEKRNDAHFGRQSTINNQHMIDYRNFVPQMPFVPSVAKTLPRKRISLKRSKKGFKNIFHLKKNKQPGMISLAENESLQPMIFLMEEKNRSGKCGTREMYSDELLNSEFTDNEMYIDTIDCCHNFCEDVASLKSFDSLTGCGEIFADESATYIDTENSKDGRKVNFITKESSIPGRSFQGGVEKLASPAKSDSLDFTRLCGHLNTPARSFTSSLLVDKKLSQNSNHEVTNEINPDAANDLFSNSTDNDLVSSSETVTDAGSPISTSDEGYYDSYSSEMDNDKKDIENLRSFPRDSYSGDALYELFYSSGEINANPALEYELSVSGHSTDDPMSIYSFCVGSEENMAPQPACDFVGDNVLQSSWKGRECLMKLCDTELTLTMGMVNWLKKTKNNNKASITNLNSSGSTTQCQQNGTPNVSISNGADDESKTNKTTSEQTANKDQYNKSNQEQCATQVASMHIRYKDQTKNQEKNMSMEKITNPSEVAKNVKNYIEKQNYCSQQSATYPALYYRSKPEANMKQLEIVHINDSIVSPLTNSSDLPNQEDTPKSQSAPELFPKEWRSPLLLGRSNVLPFFKSQCSSIISSCSSALYKMQNSGDTLIFFSTSNKSSELIVNNKNHTQDTNITSNMESSIGLYKHNGHQSIKPSDYTENKFSMFREVVPGATEEGVPFPMHYLQENLLPGRKLYVQRGHEPF
ncbi:APC membrane recruitment protein 3 [Rhinophrynus dorsalis]